MCKLNIKTELREPEIIQAFNTIETMNLTTQERDYYQSAKKVMRDRAAELLTAVENAVENAVDSTKLEIAKEMKFANEQIEKIIKYTGLTQEQIEKL